MRSFLFACLMAGSVMLSSAQAAEEKVLNLYAWSGEIPESAIQQFEKETGIKVNFSTYDSNEIMYAKLNATGSTGSGYDIVQPSSYYVDRMRRQNMLQKLDKSKLPNFKNLDPELLNQSYDPHNNYSQPLMWGVTGIFVNKDYYDPKTIKKWSDLWDAKYKDQLMLLDDSREVFSIALLQLGYSVNDSNPEHIKQAYQKLRAVVPNIKLFKSDGVITILVDEDATIGMAWNGELYKAKKENPKLDFVFPEDGFVVWIDNFVIPKGAPHPDNAHKFLNFMLRPDVAKMVSLYNQFPTPNTAAKKLLPPEIRNNPIIYPSPEVMRRGKFQMDINDEAIEEYEKYWEKFKMEG